MLTTVFQGIQNSHLETAKSLEGTVLPILARLHGEIKNKHKELTGGAGKAAKAVDVARNASQSHIEMLGQYTAAFDSAAHGRHDASHDPYVLHRGIQHRLHKQVLEENNGRHDILAVQKNFADFEGHVVQVLQQAMAAFLQTVGAHADRTKAMYSDVTGSIQHVPLDFEWTRFATRRADVLLDPNAPKREVAHISYPNMDHASTRPLIAGTLERKSRAGVGGLGGYKPAFYAVTPAGYLHQFADEDNFRKEPLPELSLYLPDCTVGGVSDVKLNVKGKDASKGKVGSALAMSHELNFKAHTAADAGKWHAVMARVAGGHTNEPPPDSAVASPVSPTGAGAEEKLPPQTQAPTQPQPQMQTQPQTQTQTQTHHPGAAGAQTSGTTETSPQAPATSTTAGTRAPSEAAAAGPQHAAPPASSSSAWAEEGKNL